MPKQILLLDKFHGGLNNNADPRDIEDDQLSEALDIMVDNVGRIRLMGGTVAHGDIGSVGTITLEPGYGLFAFVHDYDMLSANDTLKTTSAFQSAGQKYAIFQNNDVSKIYQIDSNNYSHSSLIDLGSFTNVKPSYHYVDGSLYISDGNFSNDNSFILLRFVEIDILNDLVSGGDSITNPTNLTTAYKKWTIEAKSAPPKGFAGTCHFEDDSVNATNTTSITPETFDVTWVTGGTQTIGPWVINSSLGRTPAGTTMDAVIAAASADTDRFMIWDNTGDDLEAITALEASSAGADAKITTDTAEADWEHTGQSELATGVFIVPPTGGMNMWIRRIEVGSPDYNDSTKYLNEGWYHFKYCYKYSDGTYSSTTDLTELDGKSDTVASTYSGAATDSAYSLFIVNSNAGHNEKFDIGFIFRYPYPDGVVGLEIFAHNSGGSKTDRILTPSPDAVYYHAISVNFSTSSIVTAGSNGDTDKEAGMNIRPSDHDNHTISTPTASTGIRVFLTNSDLLVTESTKTGVVSKDRLSNLRWKTSVVANRKAYLGNVKYTDENGMTVYKNDAILKSLVNSFDVFTKYGIIEASINDGDEIVKLESYADRLLQFKKNKLHIINISQELEFLEDTFMHKGVDHPSAVCKTDFGIAWVNRSGCFLYDGEKVRNLLEKKGVRLISDSEWSSFLTVAATGGGTATNESITSSLTAAQTGGGGGATMY